MEEVELANYLRYHRKRAGMSQQELGKLIGFVTKDQISKYEQSESLPPLLVALSYEAIFRVPVATLFPGIYGAVLQSIEARLAELESRLQASSPKGRKAHATARTLEWLTERRSRIASP